MTYLGTRDRRRASRSRWDRRDRRYVPGHRGGRGGSGQSSSLPIVAGLALACAAVVSGGGYLLYQDAQTLKPDELGCYAQPDQAHTMMLVDSSEPRKDSQQARDVTTFLKRFYDSTALSNERFQIINTEVDNIGSIPDPVVDVCIPPSSNADLERLGAPTTTQVFLDRQKDKVFDDTLAPAIDAMTERNPARPQRFESPILEQIQSLSRLRELQEGAGVKRMIIVSDLIQSTQDIQFCETQGHLPRFERFKTGDQYPRVKPQSLAGVEVTVLMLIRPGYGPFCTGEQELRTWWEDYFQDAGARRVDFVRLRYGVSGV